jgi:hypothetical protein
VSVLDGAAVVARHARAAGKGVETLELDHYPDPPAILGSCSQAARRPGRDQSPHRGPVAPSHHDRCGARRRPVRCAVGWLDRS